MKNLLMKNFFLVSVVLALTALALFGCVQKTPQSPQTTAAATATIAATTSIEVDSLLDSFDASLNEASSAGSEADTIPNEFDASLLNES